MNYVILTCSVRCFSVNNHFSTVFLSDASDTRNLSGVIYMCWNAEVSLNTFLFSSFVLGLIVYNNTYTQYKIEELNNIWAYIFMMSFIAMQLVEYFIWKKIDITIVAHFLIFVQPIASLMLLPDAGLKYNLIAGYLCSVILYLLLGDYDGYGFYSRITASKHLDWRLSKGTVSNHLMMAAWFFFFMFSFLYTRRWGLAAFGVGTYALSFYNYSADNSVNSMWCWLVNGMMLYYAAYLLFYLPY